MYIKVNSGRVESASYVPQTEEWLEVSDIEDDELGDPADWYWNGTEMYRDDVRRAREHFNKMLISSLKKSLAESDYKIMKFAESLLEVNSLADFLGLILRTRQELREIVRQRAEWRKQINNLEDEFKDDTKND